MTYRTGTVGSRVGPVGVRRALLTSPIGALTLVSFFFGLAFVYLGEEVHESATLPTDQRVLRRVDDATAAWPVAVAEDMSLLGAEVVVGVVGVVLGGWFLLRRRVFDALLVLGAVGGYVALILLIKPIVARERPVPFFRVPEHGYGFPSGHTMGATCLAFALGFLLWRSGWHRGVKVLGSFILALAVIVVAMSRLVLGVHYPTDVLASILLGTAWMSALIALRCAAERWRASRA